MGKTGPCQAPILESGIGLRYGSSNRPNSTCPSCSCPGDRGQHKLFLHTAASQTHRLALARVRAFAVQSKPARRHARTGGVPSDWCFPHRRGRGVRTAACSNVSRHGQGAGSPPSSPRAQGRARLPPHSVQVRPPRAWAPPLCVGICIPTAGRAAWRDPVRYITN